MRLKHLYTDRSLYTVSCWKPLLYILYNLHCSIIDRGCHCCSDFWFGCCVFQFQFQLQLDCHYFPYGWSKGRFLFIHKDMYCCSLYFHCLCCCSLLLCRRVLFTEIGFEFVIVNCRVSGSLPPQRAYIVHTIDREQIRFGFCIIIPP